MRARSPAAARKVAASIISTQPGPAAATSRPPPAAPATWAPLSPVRKIANALLGRLRSTVRISWPSPRAIATGAAAVPSVETTVPESCSLKPRTRVD
jgi:hypothetical protein